MFEHLRLMAVALPALACAPAWAVDAYAMNSLAPTANNADQLIRFDPADPAGYTVIGSTGLANIGFGGLDFDAQGNLWAYASLYKHTSGAASGLYSVNMATGAVTPVGASLQTLQDLAFNPVDGQMYGINTRQANESTLYRVNLATGVVTSVGVMGGLPTPQHYLGGLAIDSAGNFYVHCVVTDAMFVGDGASFSHLYDLPQDTAYAQGMTIDWSRGDQGYHGAVGQGIFPDYFSTVNFFETDGSGYTVGLAFGPNDANGIPPVQPGDVAVMPSMLGPCDVDHSGELTLDDVDAFVVAFGSGDLDADMTGDGVLTLDDVDAFVACFVAGS